MVKSNISEIIKLKKHPQSRPMVSKIINYCESMKHGELIESRDLEKELELRSFALSNGLIIKQTAEFRYRARRLNKAGSYSTNVAYYGSRKTIKTLINKLDKLGLK